MKNKRLNHSILYEKSVESENNIEEILHFVQHVLSGSNRDNLYGHTMGILGTYTYMT